MTEQHAETLDATGLIPAVLTAGLFGGYLAAVVVAGRRGRPPGAGRAAECRRAVGAIHEWPVRRDGHPGGGAPAPARHRYLLTAALVGVDPAPHRPGLRTRSVILLAYLAAHGILAKHLYATPPTGVPAAAPLPARC